MSAIDTENAKKIRGPMDIVVTLEALSDDALTVVAGSGQSQAYIELADYTTMQDDYDMRLLADLQGSGFPLDGSRVVYDSSVAASEADGKIGVRSVCGDTFSPFRLEVSSTNTIPSLTINVSNCTTVTDDNSNEYDATSGTVLIPVNTTSMEIEFESADTTKRVEIQYIVPSASLTWTNDDLVSVELNLRSDLNPIDPSLPESEIEVRAYSTTNIQSVLQYVLDNQPITYKAGYNGDWSTIRRFYLSEPATQEDDIITIKGVDAVSKLNSEAEPFFIGRYSTNITNGAVTWSSSADPFYMLYKAFCYCALPIDDLSIETAPARNTCTSLSGDNVASIIEGQPPREAMANMMNLLHQSYGGSDFTGLTDFWLTFVDAGIPTITWSKPSSKWDIYEADCGDVREDVARNVVKIKADNKRIRVRGFDNSKRNSDRYPYERYRIGSIDIIVGDGGAISIDQYTKEAIAYALVSNRTIGIYHRIILGGEIVNAFQRIPLTDSSSVAWGAHLYKGDYWQDWGEQPINYGADHSLEDFAYSIDVSDATVLEGGEEEFNLYGPRIEVINQTRTYTASGVGVTEEPSNTFWIGKVNAGYADGSGYLNILPNNGFKSLLARSNVTGSFTWKGDPRMQPRDVFTWHYIDGTTEGRTIESISLTHEGGGTVAEITWRKGVV